MENINFIKTNKPFVKEYTLDEPAPLFRKKFCVKGEVISATLMVCGLGYGYYYINNNKVSEDLLTAPHSDYNKTLWYNKYDVTNLIVTGENITFAMLGNGWYNECLETPWNTNEAVWRDVPKLAYKLVIKTTVDDIVIESDTTWRCTNKSPVVFNQLRNGEYYDSRLYDDFGALDYDDSDWEDVVLDTTPPKGEFRECLCEPIRVKQEYKPISINKTDRDSYVFDMGQNMAGFVRLKVSGKSGDEIVIKYAEEISENGYIDTSAVHNFYEKSVFQTDKFICNGSEFIWSPKFTYHGFRYIEVFGLTSEPRLDTVTGLFVCQDVQQTSTFECSNSLLNKIYNAGIMASYSNMHYVLTDCPTREKLGWANDAQSSTEQFLTDFDTEKLLTKWLQDIKDSMREDGAVCSIVPTNGWGFDWSAGPVSEGLLLEIPYRIYLHTKNPTLLISAIPEFKRYLKRCEDSADTDKMMDYGLWDWAGPFGENCPTPRKFINTVLHIKFLKIATLSASLAGDFVLHDEWQDKHDEMVQVFKGTFIDGDGRCTINEQTALSMIIYYDLYNNLEVSKLQLKACVEERDYHHNCGMVGMRYILHALNKCGLHEYAYRIVTSTGYPSYADWINKGATTLWEMWQCTDSKNHHMYSDVLSWFIKSIVGISPERDIASAADVGDSMVIVSPIFFDELDYGKGSMNTHCGMVEVSWHRVDNGVKLVVVAPCDDTVKLKLSALSGYTINTDNGIQSSEIVLSRGENLFIYIKNK